MALACSTAYAQNTRTWNGGGGGGGWTGAPNWGGTAPVAGDSLVFAGEVRLTSTNNFSGGTQFGSITFAAGAGAFLLTGNGVFVNGDITNNSSVLQTLTTFSGNGITIANGDRAFRASTGDLLFTTTVSVGPNTLTTEAAAGRTVTINGAIQEGAQPGNGGIRVTGAGTTVLGGTNTYTGATTLTGGTLSISAAENLQSTSSVVFANASQGTLHASETLNLGKAITQTGAGSYAAAAGKTLTLSGTVSGAGDLKVNGGAGTVVLAATNSYTGATQLTGGTLSISAASNIQNSSSILFTAGSQATLYAAETLNLGKGITQTGRGSYGAAAGKTLTVSGTIAGAGDLNVNGGGAVTLSATNTYSGATRLSSGTLTISSASNLGGGSSLVFENGSQATLNVTQTLSLGQSITQSGTGNYAVGSGNTLTLGGAISGGGDLHFNGGGTLVLTGSNTYSGATRLTSGTLSIGSGANLQSTSSIVFGSGTQSALYASQTATVNRNITQTGAGNYVVDAGNTFSLGGNISGGGDFVMKGGGNVVLAGTNAFTGSATITSGTLSIESGSNLQSTSSLIFGHSTNSTLQILGENVNLTRNVSHTGVGNYEVTVGKTLTLSGTVSGAGDLNLKGNGTMALTATNTFTGATVINTGTLAINSAANLQSTSSISFMSGTTATLHATTDGINLGKSILQTARGNYLVDGGNTLTISGTISGVGQLQKYGEGMLVLDAANNYSGRTVVNSGTLRLGASGSIINANMDIVGGVFDLNGKDITVTSTLTLGLNASSGTILSSNGTSSFSVASAILARSGTIGVNLTGAAGLTKSQAGTVVLTGSNSYLGATSVTSGTLVVDGSINSDVTVSSSGVLGGSGTINGSVTVQSGAALRPGNSPGILTMDSLSLELGGSLGIEITGLLPGFGGYDSLVVNGPVTLAGDLQVSLSIVPVYGSIFFIIQNNGDHEVLGTFNGLAQDDIFDVGGQYFRITYNANRFNGTADGGFDVALVAIPEPGTWALLGLGAAYLAYRRRSRNG